MDRKRLSLLAVGGVLLLVWLLLLRPVSFEYDGGRSDGSEPDDLPWNTVVRRPVLWESNGTTAVLGACGHGACPVSLRTDDAPETSRDGTLYWRAPWTSDGSGPVDLPREALVGHLDEDVGVHHVSTATYHARDPALDLGVVLLGVVLLRLGLGGHRARAAAVAWGAMVPLAPLLSGLWMTIFTPLLPSLLLALGALGVRWTWPRPRVRTVTSALLEAAAVLLVLGLSTGVYLPSPPVA